jgi:hypothetical protein
LAKAGFDMDSPKRALLLVCGVFELSQKRHKKKKSNKKTGTAYPI